VEQRLSMRREETQVLARPDRGPADAGDCRGSVADPATWWRRGMRPSGSRRPARAIVAAGRWRLHTRHERLDW